MFHFAAVIFSILLAVVPPAWSESPDRAQDLLRKVERAGEIGVIVTLDRGGLSRNLRQPELADALRAATVAAGQDMLLRKLASGDYRILRRYEFVPQIALKVNPAALKVLLADPSVKVYEDRPRKLKLAQSVPRVFPNHAASPYNGNNQWTVAILDTGVDKEHSFLKTGSRYKVVSEACYSDGGGQAFTDSLCPGGAVVSTASGSARPCTIQDCEHGTHVAGIAVGDGAGFDGVARLGRVIAIQVFSAINDSSFCDPDPTPCLGAWISDTIQGLERVFLLRNNFKIAAVNLSLGGPRNDDQCDDEAEEEAINLLKSINIATVAAAGNSGLEEVDAPACIAAAVAVGSTRDNADVRSSFSSNGPALDLYAPGEVITSSVPGGGFKGLRGTSMAAPHVAGAWAVVRQLKPGMGVNGIENAFKSCGPTVTSAGISRRRIDVQSVLGFFDKGCDVKVKVNIAPIIVPLLLE